MTDIRTALRTLILANGAVASKIGTRVFPGRLPQGEKRDSLVVQRISAVGGHTMDGPDGLEWRRFQIDAYSETGDGAFALAEAVKAAIVGYRGTVSWGTDSPQESIAFQGIFFDGEGQEFDAAAGLFRERRDFIVQWR